jgi:glycosyltransferase involved in cell wall biosynthesis
MRDNPSIDVVIPVYNGEKYIERAITSVMEQTLLPDRLIIVDDGSTDMTPVLISAYAGKGVTIEYVGKPNGGLSSARNEGIIRSSSSLIAFLDADDEWYPDKLERQIEVFRSTDFANLGVVYCDYTLIDANGEEEKEHFKFEIDHTVRGDVVDKLFEANKIAASGSGVLVKKECFDKAGLFDEALGVGEDWDMWLRIAKYFQFDYVPLPLVKIRRHGENMQGNEGNMSRNLLIFYNKWAGRTETREHERSLLRALKFPIIKAIVGPGGFAFACRHLSARAKARVIRPLLLYYLWRVYRFVRPGSPRTG